MNNYNTTLLTGAGFTCNFGGLLVNDIWSLLFNSKEVQSSEKLKNHLLKWDTSYNYEKLYEHAQKNNHLSIIEAAELKKAIIQVFDKQELLISHTIKGTDENTTKTAFLIFLEKNIDYFFTLNHDLFVEKCFPYFSSRTRQIVRPCAPAFKDNNTIVPISFKSNKAVKTDINNFDLDDKRNIKYIKLHGSIDWLTNNNDNLMILGEGFSKQKQSIEHIITDWYRKLFKDALKTNKHLLIIGYSFNDFHINQLIADNISNLNIHVIDILSPKDFSDKMNNRLVSGYIKQISEEERLNIPLKARIWSHLSGYHPFKLNFCFSEKYNHLLLENLNA
ncbi:MAG: SIR2 family protein [Candidatus Margulisbacteria bacterium]|nr:SIR2 family protein [Candidatus Margulisiibacteriota bacterium]